MKRLFLILLLSAAVAAASVSEEPFTLIYWIKGSVADAPGVSANGRRIYFENTKAWDIIGEAGASGRANQFLVNAGTAGVPLDAGLRYSVFTDRTGGYGAGPVEVEITGNGFEEVPPLTLVEGGGVADIRAFAVKMEPVPQIKVWFNNRLYQKALVERGGEFYIPRKPKIKMEAGIEKTYALSADPAAYSLAINNKTYPFQTSKIEGEKAIFEFTPTDELAPGNYNFTFGAQSSGAKATAASVTEIVKVTVAGGPLRLLDTPLSYPSPFNPEKDKNVIFQYTLSDNASIDIFIFNIAGEIDKKISIIAGQEGGLGQLNKVTWNGLTDQGTMVSSGVHLGNIVARDENKVLGKFKLTVYR